MLAQAEVTGSRFVVPFSTREGMMELEFLPGCAADWVAWRETGVS